MTLEVVEFDPELHINNIVWVASVKKVNAISILIFEHVRIFVYEIKHHPKLNQTNKAAKSIVKSFQM